MLKILRDKLALLLTQRAAAMASMTATTATAESESRSALTPDEETAFAASLAEVRGIDTELEVIEARIGELEVIEARTARAETGANHRRPTISGVEDPYDVEVRTMPRTAEAVTEQRSRAARALEAADGLTDAHRETVTNLLRTSDRGGALSRHLLATGREAYRSAFAKLTTGTHAYLSDAEARAVDEVRALQITTDASGGFLMPFTLDPTIILANAGTINPMRRLATVKTVATDNWQGVSSAGVTAGYGAESSVPADGSPTFAQPSVAIHQASAFVPFTVEAEDDLAMLSSDVAMMFADAKDNLEGDKFTNGTGVVQPFGIITVIAATIGSRVAAGTNDVLAVADLYAVQNALSARYRSNAQWMMALPTINLTRQFGATLGHAFLTDLGGGQPSVLLGQGLNENSHMDGVINATTDNDMVLYGDFKQYRIHDRIGLTIELIPHLLDVATGRPTGQRGWYARWRNGANCVNPAAFRLLRV